MFETIDSGEIYTLLKDTEGQVTINTCLLYHNIFIKNTKDYPRDFIKIGEVGRKITIDDCRKLKYVIEKMIEIYYSNGRSYWYEGAEMNDGVVVICWGS
jgi:hypothetical protein